MFIATAWQADFFGSDLFNKTMVFGPRGSGKTRTALQRIHDELLAERKVAVAFWPTQLNAIHRSAGVLAETIYGDDVFVASRRYVQRCYEYKNGSKFYYVAANHFDNHQVRLLEPDYVFVDECESIAFHHYLNIETVLNQRTKLILSVLENDIPSWVSTYVMFDKTCHFGGTIENLFLSGAYKLPK